MSEDNFGLSRRRFLQGSAAAAFSLGALGREALAQSTMVKPYVALPLSDLKPATSPDEAHWLKVRSQFNLIDRMVFMNNGTLGPTPRCVVETNERIIRELAEDPSNGSRNEDRNKVRAQMADFIGCSPDEVALLRSTTEGMNVFALGIDWRPGDEVLMCRHEHSGGIDVYRTLEARRGVVIKWIDVPAPPDSVDQIVGLYEKAITPKTRVIMVSHITYVTGLVMPIKELSDMAHRHGLLISVDGAHPLGMLELNVRGLGCDHYSAAGQKWLLAGTGTGVCYVKQDVQSKVWPLMGWIDPSKPDDPGTKGARKYEDNGQKHVPSVYGIATAMDFQNAVGRKNIEARDRALSERLRAGLKEIPGVKLWTSTQPQLSAALTLFSIREIPMENVVKAIMERDQVFIRTMTTGKLNAVRASTHLYNMPDEVDRLLGAVRYVAANAEKYMTTTTASAALSPPGAGVGPRAMNQMDPWEESRLG